MKKIALITGANKGIGFETAKNLGEKGFRVYIGARDEKRGSEAASQLQKAGIDAKFLQLEVTDEKSVANAATKLASLEPHLDVLINNAGIYLTDRDGKASTTTVETLLDVYQVNVFGVLRTTQAFLPLLKKSKQASIVMVSSGLGSLTLQCDPASGISSWAAIAYNSSKSALNGLTVGFANELKEFNIKVNAVNPGYNSTDLNDNKGTFPPSHGAAIVVKAAYIDAAGPTGTFVDEKADCPW